MISVVSPSRTRPSSVLLPIYRTGSASGSSTTSSGISEVAAALRRRQKKPHALRMPQKKRVGTTDSLLEAAGLDSSDSGQRSPFAPATPISYLSMPSVNAFPR
ncbi:jg7475 [Pararge aegeria aegeria]|uniref:Jg7475 protein n=1 Tax=Pararge aegeria aegeria TaxID=348720 RepID=A0A8S4R6B7_9NEOP|nr:jg7475 [Pararge aegeria aegeria]